ncbi:hypothetical protein PO124_14110 [Bacillus licheniformis]|nr:hypothetical protein [Bacillus licheniformis]
MMNGLLVKFPQSKYCKDRVSIYITRKANQLRSNLHDVLLRTVLEEKLKELNSYEYKGEIRKFSDTNIQQAIRDLDESLTNGLVKQTKLYMKQS